MIKDTHFAHKVDIPHSNHSSSSITVLANNALLSIAGLNKVLAMMTGELTYNEFFADTTAGTFAYWIVGNLVFFIFVVTVTILLQNLLLGWTISDMQVKNIANLLKCFVPF